MTGTSIQLYLGDDDESWRRYGPPTQDDDDRYDDEGDDEWPELRTRRRVQDLPLTPGARAALGGHPGPPRADLIRDDGSVTPMVTVTEAGSDRITAYPVGPVTISAGETFTITHLGLSRCLNHHRRATCSRSC